MQNFSADIVGYLQNLSIPDLGPADVAEILLITILFYSILKRVKETRAWTLFKGVLVVVGFILIAALFQMNTILWIAKNLVTFAVTAIIIVFQPELRRALETLGKRDYLRSFIPWEIMKTTVSEKISDKTVNEIVRASFLMGRVKTGALIVIEHNDSLAEYERSGIEVDAVVSSQLLINIFEKNTPLHDGAVVIRNDRVTSATCYLPLSDNRTLSKDLGTRHRAGIGVSETGDSMTVIVSEETGHISVAYGGVLYPDLTEEKLREMLTIVQDKVVEEKKRLHIKKER